jgi:hypothetical protein
MKTTRNIGGSLLASNCPEILKPIKLGDKTLIVRPVESEDTHHLVLVMGGETILAKHPNGYSCHVLATRMVEGDWERIEAQANYIVDCGGFSDIPAISRNL